MAVSTYEAAQDRYDTMEYRRCGTSGLLLPAVSLGLWHNFGDSHPGSTQRAVLRRAFDRGITHFDLANNYGPPYGQAEINFGRIMATDFKPYRDELIISSKAGYDMWPGPYGQGGSRKYLIASCDQSLKRMGLDYVDIFYSHRFDPETPLEETMGALDRIVRSGRALYAGISSYDPTETERAATIARDLGTPLLIHQPRYNMFDRWIEDGLVDTCEQEGMGIICFSPLAQGILTDKYLRGVPAQSRTGMGAVSLRPDQIDDATRAAIAALNEVAKGRDQTLAQMALSWILREPRITSVLVGASSVPQLDSDIDALGATPFTDDERVRIESVLADHVL